MVFGDGDACHPVLRLKYKHGVRNRRIARTLNPTNYTVGEHLRRAELTASGGHCSRSGAPSIWKRRTSRPWIRAA